MSLKFIDLSYKDFFMIELKFFSDIINEGTSLPHKNPKRALWEWIGFIQEER